MTYVLAALTLATLALDLVAIHGFLHYIEKRDQREAKERNALLTRIQTPHLAPALALAVEEDPSANQFVDDQVDADFFEKTQQD